MKREEVLKILKSFKDAHASEFGIVSLGLFGSVARNEASDESDVDVVVQSSQKGLYTLVHIKEELESMLHTSVDVVRYRETMNPYLKQNIQEDAVYV